MFVIAKKRLQKCVNCPADCWTKVFKFCFECLTLRLIVYQKISELNGVVHITSFSPFPFPPTSKTNSQLVQINRLKKYTLRDVFFTLSQFMSQNIIIARS